MLSTTVWYYLLRGKREREGGTQVKKAKKKELKIRKGLPGGRCKTKTGLWTENVGK